MRVYSITSRQEGFNINNIFDESLLMNTINVMNYLHG